MTDGYISVVDVHSQYVVYFCYVPVVFVLRCIDVSVVFLSSTQTTGAARREADPQQPHPFQAGTGMAPCRELL